MSKITLNYKKNDYTLEYNRQTIKTMEGQGFVLDHVTSMPATMIPMLFSGAFMKNHRGMKRALIDEIYEDIGDKTGLMSALMEMYAEALSVLVEDKADAGNVTWARVE